MLKGSMRGASMDLGSQQEVPEVEIWEDGGVPRLEYRAKDFSMGGQEFDLVEAVVTLGLYRIVGTRSPISEDKLCVMMVGKDRDRHLDVFYGPFDELTHQQALDFWQEVQESLARKNVPGQHQLVSFEIEPDGSNSIGPAHVWGDAREWREDSLGGGTYLLPTPGQGQGARNVSVRTHHGDDGDNLG